MFTASRGHPPSPSRIPRPSSRDLPPPSSGHAAHGGAERHECRCFQERGFATRTGRLPRGLQHGGDDWLLRAVRGRGEQLPIGLCLFLQR